MDEDEEERRTGELGIACVSLIAAAMSCARGASAEAVLSRAKVYQAKLQAMVKEAE